MSGKSFFEAKGVQEISGFSVIYVYFFSKGVWYGNVQAEVAARGLARRMRKSQTTAKTKHTEEEEH